MKIATTLLLQCILLSGCTAHSISTRVHITVCVQCVIEKALIEGFSYKRFMLSTHSKDILDSYRVFYLKKEPTNIINTPGNIPKKLAAFASI